MSVEENNNSVASLTVFPQEGVETLESRARVHSGEERNRERGRHSAERDLGNLEQMVVILDCQHKD